jgi:hypothetical protein
MKLLREILQYCTQTHMVEKDIVTEFTFRGGI